MCLNSICVYAKIFKIEQNNLSQSHNSYGVGGSEYLRVWVKGYFEHFCSVLVYFFKCVFLQLYGF